MLLLANVYSNIPKARWTESELRQEFSEYALSDNCKNCSNGPNKRLKEPRIGRCDEDRMKFLAMSVSQ